MIEDVLSEKIREYNPANAIEQENIIQELLQFFILASLSKAGFFLDTEFHGGTCLRMIHGMQRFSEDLDFLLKEVNFQFDWSKYTGEVKRDCSQEGIHFEILDKSKADSIGKVLILELPHKRHASRKIKIKLEIDTNPPAGSNFETSFISFPYPAAVTTQTLESGFATKSHALSCQQAVAETEIPNKSWRSGR